MRRKLSLVPALALALCLLAGCGGAAQVDVQQVKAGETISADSKWINSSIDGAIAQDTPVNLKDDFYTAVNRDWLLKQELEEDAAGINCFTRPDEVLRERMLAIVKGGGEAGENPAQIPEAQLRHNEALLVTFAGMASDWDARNAKGAEPLRPYVEAIERISSMQDMTDYLLNKDGTNFSFLFPIGISVGGTLTRNNVNTVILDATPRLTLQSAEDYTGISLPGKLYMHKSNASVRLLLQRLGYAESEIGRVIADCYRYETRLAKAQSTSASGGSMEEYLEEIDNRYSLSQIEEIQGYFPLTDILTHYGYDRAQSYAVLYPKYVSSVGRYYDARYLDEIKAYYLVHTLNDSMPLLDRAAFDARREMDKAIEENAPESKTQAPDQLPDAQGPLSEKDLETEILLDHFVSAYLNEPLDQVYIARYCTAEQKAKLQELIQSIISYYREMLQQEDWLSAQARKNAVEKLDNLAVRAIYPDKLNDYTGLDLTGCDDLMAAVARINAFKLTQNVQKINTPVERSDWNMQEIPTTWVNAVYKPTDNSINILAGIMADGFMFNVEDTQEETLAKIGTIVGHEITHGFDTTGYLFDKDGYYVNWWTPEDEQAFQLRASRLANYFSGIVPYPGATGYNGTNVQSEAIADMGGVKCMLGVAEQIPGFDYELFFKTYATLWRAKNTYAQEAGSADDVHPLNFLRTNVTLQQFEKFYETFDIQPGDGMYLAPEDRVSVW